MTQKSVFRAFPGSTVKEDGAGETIRAPGPRSCQPSKWALSREADSALSNSNLSNSLTYFGVHLRCDLPMSSVTSVAVVTRRPKVGVVNSKQQMTSPDYRAPRECCAIEGQSLRSLEKPSSGLWRPDWSSRRLDLTCQVQRTVRLSRASPSHSCELARLSGRHQPVVRLDEHFTRRCRHPAARLPSFPGRQASETGITRARGEVSLSGAPCPLLLHADREGRGSTNCHAGHGPLGEQA